MGIIRKTGTRQTRYTANYWCPYRSELVVSEKSIPSPPKTLSNSNESDFFALCRADSYSTRIYRRSPDHLNGDRAMILAATPPGRRGAVMLSMEGDRWMLTLAGLLGDHPPTDEAGSLDFAGTLPAPDIYDMIKNAEPLTSPEPFKFPASARRYYERLKKFPEGYLVFGDGICSFNPIYGQGMSAAALQAAELQNALTEGSDRLAFRFFRKAARAIDGPWTIAVGGDLRYPEVDGPRTPILRFINWYLGKLHIGARADPKLTFAFQRAAQLLDPPTSLLKPGVALRVMRGNLLGQHRPV